MRNLTILNVIAQEQIEGDRIALNQILQELQAAHCSKCGGGGHLAKECKSLARFEKACRESARLNELRMQLMERSQNALALGL